ncbi:dTDP-glucose 4,6-dehydratase, partial [gut metagenome]
ALVSTLLERYRPRAILHFAAESHVDRSIDGPRRFFDTNVLGTVNLLTCAQHYTETVLSASEKATFRFLHVSTDEVYGSLSPEAPAFTEASPYRPNSPYSASKAASDHAVRAWSQTFGLPTITTHCSNNYGPYQFPEKLIPLMITRALARRPMPLYGDGLNIRDWLHVNDHCEALRLILAKGKPGETYNIGANQEVDNLTIVRALCAELDRRRPHPDGSYADLISFVKDRPGHDRRYALNAQKLRRDLGWSPRIDFQRGLRETISWYLDHAEWLARIQSGAYRTAPASS